MTSIRFAPGRYDVTVNDVRYCVYKSDGLWWAKNLVTLQVQDAAPTKAQLLRSLEAV